jgi:hypothetical protein
MRLSLSSFGWSAFLCAALGLAGPPSAAALTPESPEVKAAVAKGLKFLEGDASDDRTGAQALIALAFVKTDAPGNHPIIQRAVARIRDELSNSNDFDGGEQIYHLGLSLVFLSSADSVAYRREIDAVLSRLLARQKPHGGWGYPNMDTGDTSMTQYGVLGLWESYRVGANPPLQAWERVCNWLLRTQDPSGAFGYQGTDPGNFNLVMQNELRPSMAAAGLGSLYVCSDHFGLGVQRNAAAEKGRPSALKEVVKAAGRDKQKPTSVDLQRLRAATQLGNGWFNKNFTATPNEWPHYYYYAYERYQSFREAVEQINDKEPAWYTAIASHLIKTQAGDGRWDSQAGAVPDTSFSILFLVRGTKKSIQQALGAGTLVGGRGLPTDANDIQLRMGNVVRKPLAGPAAQLLSVMEDPSNPDFLAAAEGLAEVKLEPDDAQLPQQLVRLRKLAGGSSPEARIIALRLLAKTRDLDQVPLMIFSLNDPDLGVVREARDALRFVSRTFAAFGPEIPEGTYEVTAFEAQRRKAIEQWKAWYLSVRPEHTFAD